MAAIARGRCGRAHHAGGRSGETLECRSATCAAQSGAVIHAASGRRANYGELATDAARMPVPRNVALKRPQDFKLIGTSAKRLDTPSKVNGTAVYGIDVRPPGVKIATLAQSPVFGGRVKASMIPRRKPSRACARSCGSMMLWRSSPTIWVQPRRARGPGGRMGRWPERQARTAAIVAELDQATRNAGAVAQTIGDVDRALAGAATKVEASYELPFLAHATLEPMNCTVDLRKDGCEIWIGTQAIARVQAAAAKVASLPPEKVVVHNHLIGGGFGRRLEADGAARAVEIAKQVEGPVKVVWTREEDIQHDMYRPYWFDRLPPVSTRMECRSPGAIVLPDPRSSRDGHRQRFRMASTPIRPKARSTLSTTYRTCMLSMSG